MADEQQGGAAFQQLAHLGLALFLELEVAHGQDLVHHQNVRPHHRSNGKTQAGDHAGGVVLHGHVHKLLQLRKFDDLVKMLVHERPVHAHHRAVQVDVLPGGQIHVKAGAQLDEGGNAATHRHLPLGGVHHARNHLEHGAFAAAVFADEGHGLAGLDAERNIFQCKEFIKVQLAAHQLQAVLLDGVGFLLGQVEPHGHIIYFNDRCCHILAPHKYRMKLRCSLRNTARPTARATPLHSRQMHQLFAVGSEPYSTSWRKLSR